ncbi:MAG TPA: UDP-N-acetylmuramoyl-tripeptide--D-alanyl-D-alanine ligase [Pseudomonadales bacterium]|nr:UDP-N-acetylmuramoyl-tripeptide--D-alanyl-D-alanine ligase [Pseudomonadales bacterium]
MHAISLVDVAQACGASWSGADINFTGVCIDSRKVQTGDVFVALKGERFDAHAFLPAVEQSGAVAAVVEEINLEISLPQLKVNNTVNALGEIAGLNRRLFSGKIIGLTGSAGKTTTKEMIAAILAQNGNPLVTAGNLNNHVGVPLTLLRLSAENDSAVIEMGASAVGEIRYLTTLVRPDVALVTNVAAAHLEGFGSIENVAKGKREIFEGLAENGVAVINLDNDWTASWQDSLSPAFRVFTYSMKKMADLYASDIAQAADGVSFVLHAGDNHEKVNLAFLGQHNVGNALAVAACCMAAEIGFKEIVSGLQAAKPYKGRLQSKRGVNGCLVIDDSYNANPASVRIAIDALLACDGTKILVLGDMGELGVDARLLHAEIGVYAKTAGVEHFLVVGELSRAAAISFGAGATCFDSWQLLADHCIAMAGKNSVFLIKGSRSAGMDRVADALIETGGSSC